MLSESRRGGAAVPFLEEEATSRLPSSRRPPGEPAYEFPDVPAVAYDDLEGGMLRLGSFEAQYEELFAEMLESGAITAEERRRLDLAAAALGLDAERVARLEAALLDAYETRADITLVDAEGPSTLAERKCDPRSSPRSATELTLPRVTPPSRREPRSSYPALDDEPRTTPDQTAPLAPLSAAELDAFDDEQPTLSRSSSIPAVVVPPDEGELHRTFEAHGRQGQHDEQWCVANVLAVRGRATAAEMAVYEAHKPQTPTRAYAPLSNASWQRDLFHPDEDRITGEIFSVIASAALLGRVSALRRDKNLVPLDPAQREEPQRSTITAVRAVAWTAATLGLKTPPLYVDPRHPGGFDIAIAAPPAMRIGSAVLTGKAPLSLVFAAGRALSWFREEHFICTIAPSMNHLEDLFLAALTIGAPDLALPVEVRSRTDVLKNVIVPCLEPKQMEKLERLAARFLARGGRTSLRKWALAAEWTACRAGLLACGDLAAAATVLAEEPNGESRIKVLEDFWASGQASVLRRKLGVAIA